MKIIINEHQLKNLAKSVLFEDFRTQRDKFINQGYPDNIVDKYLSDFKEIRDKKVKEASDSDINGLNVPKGNDRFDIDKYKDFNELEILVDYVVGQRNIGKINKNDIVVNGEPIFENDDLQIFYADSPEACIQYKGTHPASWCVATKSGNMFYSYRLKPHQPSFYFVKRKKAFADEDFNGKYKDPYHFFVLQVLGNSDDYIVTSAKNDGNKKMKWDDILKFAPELKKLKHLFQAKTISKEDRERVEKYQKNLSDKEFARLPYNEKKFYLDIRSGDIGFNKFKLLPDDLKNYYIGFGYGLSDEQLDLIRDNNSLLKRYAQIANRRFDEFLKYRNIYLKSNELPFISENKFNLIDFTKIKYLFDISKNKKEFYKLFDFDVYKKLIREYVEKEGLFGDIGVHDIISKAPLQYFPELETKINDKINQKISEFERYDFKRSLDLSGFPIKELPKNWVDIEGNLYLNNTLITNLRSIRNVNDLELYDTPITSLGELEFVVRTLNLGNTPIKNLGNLESVGNHLVLTNTPITNLGALIKVGGNLYLENTPITNLGRLERVDGYIHINNSALAEKYSIEELEEMYPQFKGKFISS